MNYGMQISASGAQAALYRQDSLANNLANINTVGFKPVLATAMHREHVRAEDGVWNLPSDTLLEALGGGVMSGRTAVSFKQGTLESTGNPLDLGIQGDGFFTVGDAANPALTRDGRFTLSTDGTLVTLTDGQPVLDLAGNTIEIDPSRGAIQISSDGLITQGGAQIATLRIADVPDRSVLEHAGNGRFIDRFGNALTLTDATGRVMQGSVEGSAVDEIDAMMGVTTASRAAQSNISMIDMQNRLLDSLVNRFARIS